MRLLRFIRSTSNLLTTYRYTSQQQQADFYYRTTSRTAIAMAPVVVTSLDLSGAKGEFKRNDAKWRNWVQDTTKSAKVTDSSTTSSNSTSSAGITFPAAGNGRYHLYVAYACPWAHRTLMVRALKGLEDAITVTIVHPIWRRTRPDLEDDMHTGWFFGQAATTDDTSATTITNADGNGGPFPLAYSMNEPDPYGTSSTTIRDVYERVASKTKDGSTGGVYSVPILWDTLQETIVSNESSEIIRMMNSEFNAFCTNPTLDLYPVELRDTINEVNDWVYPSINNGVYRCGFAKSQIAYNEAIVTLTNGFDRIETVLQKQRYIAGNQFTEADVRLFVTLLRFDEVYIVYFKCNTRSVEHSDVILNYCRDVYQMPGVKGTVDMEQIKTHYFASHPKLNYYSILPAGRNFIQLLEQPHNRDKMV